MNTQPATQGSQNVNIIVLSVLSYPSRESRESHETPSPPRLFSFFRLSFVFPSCGRENMASSRHSGTPGFVADCNPRCSVLQCVAVCCNVSPHQVRGTTGGIDNIDAFQVNF